MKNLLIIAALTLATAGTASAMTANGQLSAGTRYDVRTYVPNADLNNLSASQVSQIENIFRVSDNGSAGDDVRGQIKAILMQN